MSKTYEKGDKHTSGRGPIAKPRSSAGKTSYGIVQAMPDASAEQEVHQVMPEDTIKNPNGVPAVRVNGMPLPGKTRNSQPQNRT
ncbi:MAG: hypothetical protein M3O62_11095 [Pseudomonadota bacterium]|nr:hypothetical protein [Pseudomonadota bacterium]